MICGMLTRFWDVAVLRSFAQLCNIMTIVIKLRHLLFCGQTRVLIRKNNWPCWDARNNQFDYYGASVIIESLIWASFGSIAL